MAAPGWQQSQSRRTVDASPLETATIRATPRPAATDRGQPRLNIKEQKSVPWVAVGLGALIVLAIAVILTTTGLVSLPF